MREREKGRGLWSKLRFELNNYLKKEIAQLKKKQKIKKKKPHKGY